VLLLMLVLLTGLNTALATVSRFAVFVGNDTGGPDSPRLYFAESDAVKMHHLFTTTGGVDAGQALLLLGRDRNTVLRSMGADELRTDIAAANARGDETVLIFYYSGHADAEKLQLGRSWVTWGELERLLDASGADMTMAFLDACQSGAMTRERGGQRAPRFVFDLTERLNTAGQVIITSSSSDEASQESDEIGGGYFTHFLASALSGAGDSDGDGQVTLSEAYQYVYRETAFHTRNTRSGAQHPTFSNQLRGHGEIVLSDLSAAGATLVLPEGLVGRYAIFDSRRKHFIAEVSVEGTEQRLALPASTYLVQARYPTHLLSAEIDLRERGTVTVQSDDFVAMEYEDDPARGAITRHKRQEDLPQLTLRATVGGLTFTDEVVQAQYFPTIPMAGISGRWSWQKHSLSRGERWIGADLTAGSGGGALVLDGWSVALPVRMSSANLGASAGFATRRRFVQAGIGLRLAGVYILREFPGHDLASQDLVSLSPGLSYWVGLRPGAWELDVELRSQYLPYALDDPELPTGYSEAYLTLGYRF
jgi:hypothetical protein